VPCAGVQTEIRTHCGCFPLNVLNVFNVRHFRLSLRLTETHRRQTGIKTELSTNVIYALEGKENGGERMEEKSRVRDAT